MGAVKVEKLGSEVTQWAVPFSGLGGFTDFGTISVDLKRWAYRGLPVPGYAGVSADPVTGDTTLYVTPAFPEEMYAIVLIAHDSVGGSPYAEWSTEIPTEPGYYWFHGTSDMMRRNVSFKNVGGFLVTSPNPLPAKTILARVKSAGGSKQFTVYISDGAYIYPKQEGYIGHWLKFDPPVPPKISKKRLTSREGRDKV